MRKYRQNITEEELMDVFRKAAQVHEPFCDPKSIADGWQTIEASLDRRRRRRVLAVWQFLRSHAWLLCLLIISGLLLMPLRFNNKTVLVVHNRETPNDRRSSQQRVSVGGIPLVVEFHEVLPAGSKPALYKTGTVQLAVNDRASISHTGKVAAIPNNTDQTGVTNIGSAIAITSSTPLSILPVASVSIPEKKIAAASLPQPGDTTEKEIAIKTSQKKYSRWSIGVLAATEWNKGGASLSRLLSGGPGLTAGFLIQYKLSPRLSVETGLLLSNKRYNADSGSYKPNGNTYYNLLGVVADCHVLDVPVNLRYDLLQRKEHLVFARAGLSSFWMQKETYNITRLNNGAIDQYKLQLFNDNHHPFAVLNLGIGYERQWRNISWQVSPYVKLPLTGIGHGDVKLLALGTFVLAGYRFNTKK